MTPRFSFTKKGKWKLELNGIAEEIEILRITKRFNHRVVLSFKDKHYDPYVGKDVTEDCVTTLDDFADESSPLGSYWTFRFSNELEVEEWEAQVTKRIKAITTEIAELIPEPEPTAPDIPEAAWFSHAAIIAQTGRGKTNAVYWRIAQLRDDLAAGRHTLLFMEPKGTAVERVLRWTDLPHERVIIIDPDRPLAINLFDKGDGSPQALREALSLSNYVLSTMTIGLTAFQESALTYPLRLLFATDRPTMDGLINILRYGGKNHPALSSMPERVQDYFRIDFERAQASRNQLMDRFNALLSDPVFERLFSGETTFDLYDAIQRGSIIVIDARESKLGKATKMYGRFFIAQASRARLGSPSLPEEQRTPTSFIIDEAQTFIRDDELIATILDKAREARMGVVLAFHHLEQIAAGQVRDSVLTNTALKFAARTSADIFNLCRSMGGTGPELLSTLKDYEFAFFSPSLTHASKIKLPHIEFGQHPRSRYLELIEESYRCNQPEVKPSRKPEPSPEPEEDIGFGKL